MPAHIVRITTGVLMVLLAALAASGVAAAATKEEMHEEMVALAQEMRALKPNLADPAARVAYDAKHSRYAYLRQQMGGDARAATTRP